MPNNSKSFGGREVENGQYILPSVPSGPRKGTVPKGIIDGMNFKPILAQVGDQTLSLDLTQALSRNISIQI